LPDLADSDGMSKKETYPKGGGRHILGICAPVPLGNINTQPSARRPNDAAGRRIRGKLFRAA
jgi:hypothetical protein